MIPVQPGKLSCMSRFGFAGTFSFITLRIEDLFVFGLVLHSCRPRSIAALITAKPLFSSYFSFSKLKSSEEESISRKVR